MDGASDCQPLKAALSRPALERVCHTMNRALISVATLSLGVCAAPRARAEQTVQIPIDTLLDGRPVSTFTAGAVVRWTTGVDQHDGFATSAAVAKLGQTGPALPGDGVFAATASHPDLALHFSDVAAASSGQAHILAGAGNFQFDVPPATYSQLFLAMTSSSGDSALTITLDYSDANPTIVNLTLPDWGTGKPLPTDPPIFFDLISGLHKWDEQDDSVDTPSHALTGVVLSPAAGRELTRVEVSKPSTAQYLVFWGATGVAIGDVGGSGGGAGAAPTTAGNGGLGGVGAGGAGGRTSDGTSGSATAGGSAGSPGTTSSGGAGSSSAGATSVDPAAGRGNSDVGATTEPSSGCALVAAGPRRPGVTGLLALLFVGAWRRRVRRATR
jgi:hypothetical protein